MDTANTGKRGTISQTGSILHIQNALVEDVYTSNSRTGYVLVSYALPGQKEMVFIELLRLNVSWDTILINQFGDPITLCSIRKGMWVNTEFSSAMTRSIPPQARAYRIVAIIENRLFRITTDAIVSVDAKNGFLYTGNPNDMTDQMRFVITNATEIMDLDGNLIPLTALQPGQVVRVEHANFQTASIPPQTTAFRIKVVTNS